MKPKQETAGQRIERIRGDRTQAEFGALLGSASQSAVSAWERDDKDRAPSSAIYFRLAALAGDPADVIFFLEQGGVSSDAVISVADSLLRKGEVKMDTILATAEAALQSRLGDTAQRAKSGKDFIVPPYHGQPQIPFDVSVPALLVSRQASTFYLVTRADSPYRCIGYGVAPGEIIVFESYSPESAKDLVGEKVIAEFKDGLYVGRLAYIGESGVYHLAIGPADEFPMNFHAGGSRIIWSSGPHPQPEIRGFRKVYEPCGAFGIWLAQFSGGTHPFWKKMARLHGPR